MIHLEKIDAKNVWEICSLQVSKSQAEYVSSNGDSIIEAYTRKMSMKRRPGTLP